MASITTTMDATTRHIALTAVGEERWQKALRILRERCERLREVPDDDILERLLQTPVASYRRVFADTLTVGEHRAHARIRDALTSKADGANCPFAFVANHSGSSLLELERTHASPPLSPQYRVCMMYKLDVVHLRDNLFPLQIVASAASVYHPELAMALLPDMSHVPAGFGMGDMHLVEQLSGGELFKLARNTPRAASLAVATPRLLCHSDAMCELLSRLNAAGVHIYMATRTHTYLADFLTPTDRAMIRAVAQNHIHCIFSSDTRMLTLHIFELTSAAAALMTDRHPEALRVEYLELPRPNYHDSSRGRASDVVDRIRSNMLPLSNAMVNPAGARFMATHAAALAKLKFSPTTLQRNIMGRLGEVLDQPVFTSFGGVIRPPVPRDPRRLCYTTASEPSTAVLVPAVDEERLDSLLAQRAAVVCPSTGAGKTFIGLLAATLFTHEDLPNLVVVPDLLATHWHSEMVKHGFNTDSVAVLSKASDITRRVQDLSGHLRLFIVGFGLARTAAWAKLGVSHFYLTVVDEVQDFSPKTKAWQVIFGDDSEYTHERRVVLTATPQANWQATKQLLGTNRVQDYLKVTACRDSNFIRRHTVFGERNDSEQVRRVDGSSVTRKRTRENETDDGGVIVTERRLQPSQFIRDAHLLLDGFGNFAHHLPHRHRVLRIMEMVCSGCVVDEEAVLALLKRLLEPPTARVSGHNAGVVSADKLLVLDTRPPRVSFETSRSNSCCVCLCEFDEPLQLAACNHVLCKTCLLSMIDICRARCPHCRTSMVSSGGRVRAYSNVRFSSSDTPPPAPAPSPAAAAAAAGGAAALGPMSQRAFQQLLETRHHVADSDSDSDSDSDDEKKKEEEENKEEEEKEEEEPKLASVRAALTEFAKSKMEGKQMVLFTKRTRTAELYVALARRMKLCTVVAGHCGATRRESSAAIESFRQQGALLLVSSYRYATGFDLCSASEMLITDVDLDTSKLVQALGRTQRVGRVHNTVRVTVLLFDGCFDHCLYTEKAASFASLSQTTATRLERFCLTDVDGTRYNRVKRTMALVRAWTTANPRRRATVSRDALRSDFSFTYVNFTVATGATWRICLVSDLLTHSCIDTDNRVYHVRGFSSIALPTTKALLEAEDPMAAMDVFLQPAELLESERTLLVQQ